MSKIHQLLATTMAFNNNYGDMFYTPTYKVKEVPLSPSDKQKNKPKKLHTFSIKGIEIEASNNEKVLLDKINDLNET